MTFNLSKGYIKSSSVRFSLLRFQFLLPLHVEDDEKAEENKILRNQVKEPKSFTHTVSGGDNDTIDHTCEELGHLNKENIISKLSEGFGLDPMAHSVIEIHHNVDESVCQRSEPVASERSVKCGPND